MAPSLELFFFLGLIFGPIAAVMASLITYEEYRHHYPGRKEPVQQAVRAGLFTFVVFMAVAVLIGVLVGRGSFS